jgi:prepilin-type N-terminal cleavage/methylation domain-containing protein
MQTMMTKKINKTTNQSTKAQKGFSLIELSMVISVIALLLIAANFAFNSVKRNLDVQEVTEALEFHFVTAVQQCQNRRGNRNLTSCGTVAAITAVSPLASATTPFGDTWGVAVPAAIGSPLVVTYPLDGADDSDALGADLAIKLSAINGVNAVFTAANDDIVVTYQP